LAAYAVRLDGSLTDLAGLAEALGGQLSSLLYRIHSSWSRSTAWRSADSRSLSPIGTSGA
jgi:hypothetical protein